MRVTANGFPKAGNHALVKGLQLLGVDCDVSHIPVAEGVPADVPHVFIKRDPRNIICSWLRFQGRPVTQGMFLTCLDRFQERGLVDEMAEYEGWLHDTSTIVVRYEDLIASDVVLRRLASVLEVPYLDDAFTHLPGMTRTWHKQHSDYQTIWTPEVEAGWVAAGGPDLLKRWGY
jgi:hypothetical protein